MVKVTNVVEENLSLKQELREAFQEVNKLQTELNEVSQKLVDLEKQ